MAYKDLKTSHKWIIAIVGIIAISIAIYFLYKATTKDSAPGTPPTSTTTSNPGIAALVAEFLTGGASSFSNLFGGGKPKDKPVNCISGCDQNKPGFDCNGFLDAVNCGAGRFVQQ